ncbi:MAG: dynamin family protein, partial [Burkholderiales bacterium]
MSESLEGLIEGYGRWREEIRAGIESFQAWLDRNGHVDIQQSLRIYDVLENLKNDRLILAFLAEYSRGKSELINAMFFSDFKQRLLPSDVGRTTMCPTEIFYDPKEEPYIRLLPIETRKEDPTIGMYKTQPEHWVKLRLNMSSQKDVLQAMASLAETKQVSVEQAEELGLLDPNEAYSTTLVTKGKRVQIPTWRHAMINYPHPLLKSGLVILDTPGLNALGTEPELTLRMVPNAHAVVFLLAMDTGVTKSDMEIWERYVQSYQTRRIAVLNKVDLTWDELKSEEEIQQSIQRQINQTAELLKLGRDQVIALSAQKALIGRVRNDPALVKRSNIEQLETLIAHDIIPAKQQIVRDAVSREMGVMVDDSLQSLRVELAAARTEHLELAKLSGKNRDIAQAMLTRLEQDRAQYMKRMESLRNSYGTLLKQGHALTAALSDEKIEKLFEKSRNAIEGSWTTAGLMGSMNSLFGNFSSQADSILAFGSETRAFVEGVYTEFKEKFGITNVSSPSINLEKHILDMQALRAATEKFCKDPVNVMTEKHFLVKRFYGGLVTEAREVFRQTRKELDHWVRNALQPIAKHLKEHQALLEKRVENLKKISQDLSTLQLRIKQAEARKLALGQQVG